MAVISPDHDLYPGAGDTCVQCAQPAPDGNAVVRWAAEAPTGPVLFWHGACVGAFVEVVSEDATHLGVDELQAELIEHAGELAAQFRGVETRPGDEHDHAPWPADEATTSS